MSWNFGLKVIFLISCDFSNAFTDLDWNIAINIIIIMTDGQNYRLKLYCL